MESKSFFICLEPDRRVEMIEITTCPFREKPESDKRLVSLSKSHKWLGSVNLWFPVARRVTESRPLAICDSRTVSYNDVSEFSRRTKCGTCQFHTKRDQKCSFRALMEYEEGWVFNSFTSVHVGLSKYIANFKNPHRDSVDVGVLLFQAKQQSRQ